MSRAAGLIPALTLAICASGAAMAQDAELKEAADAAFTAADFDQSGTVSWEEFRNRVIGVFGHLDKNEDGRIAGEEHPEAVMDDKPVQPGNVTVESFTASIAEAFKTADKDGDGELSLTEWSGSKS